MKHPKPIKKGDEAEEFLDFLSSSLALTSEQRVLLDSTEALRELSMGQISLVMSAFYGD